MCGRFTITLTVGFSERFGLDEVCVPPAPRYNIAPSQPVPVIVSRRDGRKVARTMTWGLIPSWARDLPLVRPLINARAETLPDRRAFRGPLEQFRCLVPATGFYEWQSSGGRKIPHYIRRKDGDLFAFAGLFDIWKGRDPAICSFSIVTTTPNALVVRYHDRMPAILQREFESRWLAPGIPDPADLARMLTPYPEELLEAYQVSAAVNDPGREGPELVRRVHYGTLPE